MIFVDFGVMESLLSNHAKNGEGTDTTDDSNLVGAW